MRRKKLGSQSITHATLSVDPQVLVTKLKSKSWHLVLKNKDPIQLFFPETYDRDLQE